MNKTLMERVTPGARFIWGHGEQGRPNTWYMFRKEFTVDKPMNLNLRISAYVRYRVYLNGEFIGDGPPPSAEFVSILDSRTIQAKAGVNCLSAEVWDMNGGRAYFIAEIFDNAGRVLLETDNTWRTILAPMWNSNTQLYGWNSMVRYQEFYDACAVPDGWQLPGFDDSRWGDACVVKPVPLVARDIPYMNIEPVYADKIDKVEEAIGLANRGRPEDLTPGLSLAGKPLEFSTAEGLENLLQEGGVSRFRASLQHQDRQFTLDGFYDPCVVLDFGKVINGYFEFDIEGAAGQILDIGYAERLTDGHFVNTLEGLHGADRYIMKNGRQRYRFAAWKAFRFIKLRFRNCFEAVTVYWARAAATSYPYTERGSFRSGDGQLHKIFDICRYTIRLCSNEIIMDTPWRESAQWSGDIAAVSVGGIFACFGDTALVKKFLWQCGMAQLPTGFIQSCTANWNGNWRDTGVDYSMHWAESVWNYYEYTGDAGFLHRFYPQVSKLVYALADYLDEHGLLGALPYQASIDWAKIDGARWTQQWVDGSNAFLNALLYGVAEKIIKMAELVGDSYMAEKLAGIRAGVKNSFRKRFFNDEKGCYVDANHDGRLSGYVSEHANMAAIGQGLCEGAEAQAIIQALFVDKNLPYTRAEPFATAFTLRALDRAGRIGVAYQIIRERWGAWMADKGFTSTTEEWGMNGSFRYGEFAGFMRTLSHAWSAGPAEFLIKNTIGLEILEPGCARVRVSPADVGLDYEIIYPLPQGDLSVKHLGGKNIITAPLGVEVEGAI